MTTMRVVFAIFSILTLIYAQEEAEKETKPEDKSKVILPPCSACSSLVTSFLAKAKERTNFEDIKQKVCSDVVRGEIQCKQNLVKWEPFLKTWFSDQTNNNSNLRTWLCVDKLQVCCEENFFGPNCEACRHQDESGKICSGNGKCKGSGTRKGNGECSCDSGFDGEKCQRCAHSHYQSYQDNEKTLCSPCHHSCLGQCTGAGPKKCLACKNGFIMHAEHGCQDIDECKAGQRCNAHQFCLNLEGSFRCMNCDTACKKCHDQGPENCIECADGYMRSGQDRVCVKDESGKVLSIANARYFTYGGLCIATAIIFQRSTLIAGALGLVVAIYISIAEYYLQNMDGELQLVPKMD